MAVARTAAGASSSARSRRHDASGCFIRPSASTLARPHVRRRDAAGPAPLRRCGAAAARLAPRSMPRAALGSAVSADQRSRAAAPSAPSREPAWRQGANRGAPRCRRRRRQRPTAVYRAPRVSARRRCASTASSRCARVSADRSDLGERRCRPRIGGVPQRANGGAGDILVGPNASAAGARSPRRPHRGGRGLRSRPVAPAAAGSWSINRRAAAATVLDCG